LVGGDEVDETRDHTEAASRDPAPSKLHDAPHTLAVAEGDVERDPAIDLLIEGLSRGP
jgi:hypothetical protein